MHDVMRAVKLKRTRLDGAH